MAMNIGLSNLKYTTSYLEITYIFPNFKKYYSEYLANINIQFLVYINRKILDNEYQTSRYFVIHLY